MLLRGGWFIIMAGIERMELIFDTIPLIPVQPLPHPPQLRCHQPPVSQRPHFHNITHPLLNDMALQCEGFQSARQDVTSLTKAVRGQDVNSLSKDDIGQ